jgi:hypothetical protein
VIADGRTIVSESRHTTIDVPRALTDTIAALTGDRRTSPGHGRARAEEWRA